jgi:small subunit ribosomal protein S4
MGDPKFSRKLYDTPSHPWKKDRIKEENALIRKSGLKNKKEVWRTKSLLGRFRGQARKLVARMRTGDLQAEKEKDLLLKRMRRMGLLGENATLDDVLSLTVEDILSRRFQTIVYLRGMAHTPKQARQFIVHGHASISGRKMTIPGYFVLKEEEEAIAFRDASPISSEIHPERPGADKAELTTRERPDSPVKATIKLETGEDEEEEKKGDDKKGDDKKEKGGEGKKDEKKGKDDKEGKKEGGGKEGGEPKKKAGKKEGEKAGEK